MSVSKKGWPIPKQPHAACLSGVKSRDVTKRTAEFRFEHPPG